jgi:hypothetical protein
VVSIDRIYIPLSERSLPFVGRVSRDFLLQVFLRIIFFPDYNMRVSFDFFRQLTEIFVSDRCTAGINEDRGGEFATGANTRMSQQHECSERKYRTTSDGTPTSVVTLGAEEMLATAENPMAV